MLVLLDGQPLTGSKSAAQFDLSRLPASIVERIEVVKGPQSVLYGTDAMGGVINIITRGSWCSGRFLHALAAEASAIAGSHNRLDITTHLGGQATPAVPFGVDVGHEHIDLAPGLTGDAGAFADRWNFAPRLQFDASPTLRLEAGGLGVIKQQRYRTGQLFNFGDNTCRRPRTSVQPGPVARRVSRRRSRTPGSTISRERQRRLARRATVERATFSVFSLER